MTEITKDVSAMANAAGGIIIYGIKEYDAADKRHLPEKIDPIPQNIFSKEWLEQVINNIRPRIEGLIIHPIPLDTDPNHVAYMIEIPQSTTAHQATDFRYYKRVNFLAIPMEDYEVRDTMGRQQFPKIELSFEIQIKTKNFFSQFENRQRADTSCTLVVYARNVGRVYAQYVNSFIQLPFPILHSLTLEQIKHKNEETIIKDGIEYYEYHEDNTVRDVIDTEYSLMGSTNKYGPSRYDPILPGLSHAWKIIISDNFEKVNLETLNIKWTVFADNALPVQGKVMAKDIKIVDHQMSKKL